MVLSIDSVLAHTFIRTRIMNKYILILLISTPLISFSETGEDRPNQVESVTEDEEIIGGIGGTGLMDLERPELLERPDIDIDDLRDAGLDEALSPGDITNDSDDMIDSGDMGQP